MSLDYRGLGIDVAAILAEFGGPLQMRRELPGAYDPTTGVASVDEIAQTVVAVVFPFADRFINGTLVLSGDLQVYVAPGAGLAPQPGDVLTIGAADYTVVTAAALAPAGVDVLYTLQVRK